jgi:hypothetical protein
MKKILFIAIAIFSLNGFARSDVEAIDRIDVPINTLSEKKLTLTQVRSLIKSAGGVRGWEFANGQEPNSLVGTIWVRNKHMISVNIPYKVDSYSIYYKDSSNMNAMVNESGKTMIHPKYNEWVSNLMMDIRSQSAKF